MDSLSIESRYRYSPDDFHIFPEVAVSEDHIFPEVVAREDHTFPEVAASEEKIFENSANGNNSDGYDNSIRPPTSSGLSSGDDTDRTCLLVYAIASVNQTNIFTQIP